MTAFVLGACEFVVNIDRSKLDSSSKPKDTDVDPSDAASAIDSSD